MTPFVLPEKRTTRRGEACNPDRFCERVMADYEQEHAYCRCCGREIAPQSDGFDDTPDGYCRRCDLGHPEPVKVERPRLFGGGQVARG